MQRIVIVALAIVVVTAFAIGSATAFAAKPQSNGSGKDVIDMSNGFPSGEHHNLNIHGMKEGYICEEIEGGNSVRVSLYDTATIQYVSNKKSSVANLTVLDPCAVDGGTAKVQLPYEQDGYFVFGRIGGTPNNNGNNKDGDPSRIILYPNVIVDACNWNSSAESEEEFGTHTSCDEALLPLGVIVGDNLYTPNPANATFERFDPIPSGNNGKGTGRSKGMDITRLFTYTGWAADASLDIGNSTGGCLPGQDGILDNCDVPLTAWTIITDAGFNPEDYDPHIHNYPNCGDVTHGVDDGQIDIEEWLAFQEDLGAVACNYYCEEFILNIADLVVTEQEIENQGAKLLQIRFYPVDTTVYTP
jgi:hypothetical protein